MKFIDQYRAFTFKEFVYQFLSNIAISFLARINYTSDLSPYLKKVSCFIDKGFKVIRIDKKKLRLTNDRECYFIRRYGSDIKVFDQVVINEEYKSILTLLKKCGLNKVEINVVDCGSNIGLFSNWILNRVKVNTLVSIEADYDNFLFQKMIVCELGLEHRVTLLHRAVWSDSKTLLKISSDFRDGQDWSRSVKPASNNENSKLVNSISLNQVFDEFMNKDIHILKIDIEGAEKAVFENETSFDRMLINTKIVAIEIHEEANCSKMVLEKLYNYGFFIETIGETTFGYRNFAYPE